MSHRQRWSMLSILLALSLLGGQSQPSGFNYGTAVGLISLDTRGPCLSIPNPELRPGNRLSVTWVHVGGDTSTPELLSAEITGQLVQACEPASAERDDSFYRLSTRPDTLSPQLVYFAILTPPSDIRGDGDSVRWDLDRDGVLEVFRACTSSEGVHFTIWSGIPLEGERRWHRYYYLGYEVEPTCTGLDY